MSIPFNSTSTTGLIQLCEDNCGFNRGDISGSTDLLKKFTGYMNLGLDDMWGVILQSCNLGGLDDNNYTDYPFYSTNLVSGQRDYPYSTDQNGNVILDIHKVMIADPSGKFKEIYSVNQETITQGTGNQEDVKQFFDGYLASGTPKRYSKTGGNSILLDVIPNYNMSGGLLLFGTREASYFTVNNTTKKAGVPGIYQSYPAIFACEMYGSSKMLKNLKSLEDDKASMQRSIQVYYAQRDKDVPKRMTGNVESMR